MNGFFLFLIVFLSIVLFSPLVYYGIKNLIGLFNLIVCNDILLKNKNIKEIDNKEARVLLRILYAPSNEITRKLLVQKKSDEFFAFLRHVSCLTSADGLSDILFSIVKYDKSAQSKIESFISDSNNINEYPDFIFGLAQKCKREAIDLDKRRLFLEMAKWKTSHQYTFNRFIKLYEKDKDIQKLLSLI